MGTDVKIYIWDTTDNKWVEGGGAVEKLNSGKLKLCMKVMLILMYL